MAAVPREEEEEEGRAFCAALEALHATCPICLEGPTGATRDTVYRLPCRHWMHKACAAPLRNDACPLCRTSLQGSLPSEVYAHIVGRQEEDEDRRAREAVLASAYSGLFQRSPRRPNDAARWWDPTRVIAVGVEWEGVEVLATLAHAHPPLPPPPAASPSPSAGSSTPPPSPPLSPPPSPPPPPRDPPTTPQTRGRRRRAPSVVG